jgi:hypothetical protein
MHVSDRETRLKNLVPPGSDWWKMCCMERPESQLIAGVEWDGRVVVVFEKGWGGVGQRNATV